MPARNAAPTLASCLAAAQANLEACGEAGERIVVDDGSTDATAEIALRAGARVLAAGGRGPGAARNLGWRATAAPFVWFVDSDCVPEPGSLARLLAALAVRPEFAGAGGSYSNLVPDSWLATAIHEEIVWRHRRMQATVDHLGSFHALFRRDALAEVGGFDERRFNGPGRPGAEDMDLSFRLRDAGWSLAFDGASRVGHHHPVRVFRYLRAQMLHGRFGARLLWRDRARLRGTSYSDAADHLEPPLALLVLVTGAAALAIGPARVASAVASGLLMTLTTARAARIARESANCRALVLAPLGFFRAFARAVGALSAIRRS